MSFVPENHKSDQTETVLEMRQLNYFYESAGVRFQALFDIDLVIKKGEFVAITGSSGSGKSTLMNLIGTLATCQHGTMSLAGTSTHDLTSDQLATLRNQEIGFIFQQFHLLPRLSVLENVLLPVSYMTPRPNPDEFDKLSQKAMALLKRLGIEDQAKKYPPTLSGGQKQRTAIARALLLDPKILLADEPTGALDSRTSEEVLQLFADLHAEGRTVIMITHDPDVTKVARRRIAMSDGRIIQDETQPGLSRRSQEKLEPITPNPNQLLESSTPPLPSSWIPWALIRRFMLLIAPLFAAFQSLTSSKLRTFLTSLGLTIGVGAITTMITLGNGARDVILGIFNQAGGDRIFFSADYRSIMQTGGNWFPGIDVEKELPVLQKTFGSYAHILPGSEGSDVKVYALGRAINSRLETVYDINDFKAANFQLKSGRAFAPHEYAKGGQMALVGSDFADEMFPKNSSRRLRNPSFPLGEKIAVRGVLETTLTIVGVLKPRDNPFNTQGANSQVLITRATFTHYTGIKKSNWINAAPFKGVEHRWLADSITQFLTMRYGLRYPFRAHVPEEFIAKIMIFVTIFQALTALIGSLCILVGGIGIMNIMLVTIAERIKEIGLRKAVGASGRDITRQFLLECMFLCTISGLIGALGGAIFCNAVAIVGHMFVPQYIPNQLLIDPIGLIAGLATALGCGLTFGMMPALKAARMDPSEALRSE
jgi:macrolide transport system ATP-binding/permease protein